METALTANINWPPYPDWQVPLLAEITEAKKAEEKSKSTYLRRCKIQMIATASTIVASTALSLLYANKYFSQSETIDAALSAVWFGIAATSVGTTFLTHDSKKRQIARHDSALAQYSKLERKLQQAQY